MGAIADAVRSDRATKLERLGSDRGLLALTAADLDGETVRRRIAATDAAVADVLAVWSSDADGDTASVFADAAETKRGHVDTLVDEVAVGDAPGDPIAEALTGFEGTDERLGGGLVGYPLVADGRYLQAVNLFVNEADESSADRFRGIRTETADLIDRGESLIGDADRAVEAATAVVDAAYGDYVDALEGLGIDPKTVC